MYVSQSSAMQQQYCHYIWGRNGCTSVVIVLSGDRQLHQLKTNASQPSTGPLKQTPSQCRATARRRIVTQCSASAAGQFSRSQDASALQSDVPALVANLRALYQFSRPHTMLGTFISICSVSLLAMVSYTRPYLHFLAAFRLSALHLHCGLCAVIYAVHAVCFCWSHSAQQGMSAPYGTTSFASNAETMFTPHFVRTHVCYKSCLTAAVNLHVRSSSRVVAV